MGGRRDLAADCAVAERKARSRRTKGSKGSVNGAASYFWQAPFLRARRWAGAHFGLAFNAGAMALATIANGGLGFVYWWVLARSFTPSAVGIASADISLIGLFSLAADLGLGTLLQGEIPRQRGLAPHLVSAALLASLASAGAFGVVYLAMTAVFAPSLGISEGIPTTRLLVFVGIVAQTVSSVVDAALVGVLKAPLRLYRNLLFAVSKLLIVIALAAVTIPEDYQLNAIIGSWVIGGAIALLALAGMLRSNGARIWHSPRFDLLRTHFSASIWHCALNVAGSAPTLILPVLIAVAVSPEKNAPFYSMWTLLVLAGVGPTALATVLFTVGARDSAKAAASIRFSLLVSLGFGAVAAVGFWLLSSVLLGFLNPVYSDLVGSDLRFLGLSIPLTAIKAHYMTVQRLENRVRTAAFVLTAFGALEILLAALGASFQGLLGVTMGWLTAMAIEAAFLWPAIAKALGDEGLGLIAAAREALNPLRRGSGHPTAEQGGIADGPSDNDFRGNPIKKERDI
jgi:O-antigen/teichoic acid export membrane protein